MGKERVPKSAWKTTDGKGAKTFPFYNLPPRTQKHLEKGFFCSFSFSWLDKIKVDGNSCLPQHFANKKCKPVKTVGSAIISQSGMTSFQGTQQFIKVLILVLSLALIKKFWSTIFLLMQWYGQHQYYDIYILMMFWMKRCKVRKTYLESEACVWNLNCCLQMFWSQQEQQKRKCQVIWFKEKNKGLVFCL